MTREVCVTQTSRRDLAEALDYIERELKNPQAADSLLEEVGARLESLSELAERHPVIDDPVCRTWGLRLLRVRNYLAFYEIDGARVFVVRFLYVRRDWLGILRQELASGGGFNQDSRE